MRPFDDTAGMSTDEELEYEDYLHQFETTDTNPLNIAIPTGNYKLVERLIKKGEDVNKIDPETNLTPLTDAISESNFDIVKLLIDNNADINKRDGDGNSPTDMAIAVQNIDIIELLIKIKTIEAKQRLEISKLQELPLDIIKQIGEKRVQIYPRVLNKKGGYFYY